MDTYTTYPKITEEWVCQVALNAFGDAIKDRQAMRVIFVNPTPSHMYKLLNLKAIQDDGAMSSMFVPTLLCQTAKWYDPLQKEVYAIGYEPVTNTVLVERREPIVVPEMPWQ